MLRITAPLRVRQNRRDLPDASGPESPMKATSKQPERGIQCQVFEGSLRIQTRKWDPTIGISEIRF
ncbi:MAG: hypothetical protein ACKOAU_04135 [Pirellula sp.]